MNLSKPITMSGWKLAAGLLLFWSTGASMGQIPPDHVWPLLRPLAHHLHGIANFTSIVCCFVLVWASRAKSPPKPISPLMAVPSSRFRAVVPVKMTTPKPKR